MEPLVSVGIPTYNRPDGLRRTLEHITAQTYKNIEIIVSNNCSPNKQTDAVVHDFINNGVRIHYFRQKENKGMGYNFRFVLKVARGEYFMWAADDDEWDPEFISTCMKIMGPTGFAMTGMDLYNRKRNTDIPLAMPILSLSLSKYQNIKNFLSTLNSNLIYGIHRRKDIQWVLGQEFFDFYDLFFELKQILNCGCNLSSKRLIKIATDSEEYILKPYHPQPNKVFNYLPFLLKVSKVLLLSGKLSPREKIHLEIIFVSRVVILFTMFEKKARPSYIRILINLFEKSKIFLKIFRRFVT